MKKLLMVTTVPSTLRSFLLPFAAHFRAQGWQVDAMACGISTNPECLQGFDRVWEVKWSRNPLDPRNLLSAPPVIRKIVTREKYDLVHVHTPVAAFVTRYALKDLRKQLKLKVIYTAHGFHFFAGGNPLKNFVFINLEKFAGRWTDYLVTINHEDKKSALNYRLLAAARCRYMPGIGVDLAYYNRQAVSNSAIAQVRQELGLGSRDRLLLSVAEFTARKHHVDAVAAFAKLARTDVHLAFAGTGPLMGQMRQLAIKLGYSPPDECCEREYPRLCTGRIASMRTRIPRAGNSDNWYQNSRHPRFTCRWLRTVGRCGGYRWLSCGHGVGTRSTPRCQKYE
jgi:glycosyltransferase involved in cell wall biosynthesis